MLVKKLSENATYPIKASEGAAGWDLSSAEDGMIPARGKGIIKTDLSMSFPPGVYGRIAPRSGLAWKNHIDIGAGVIDRDYTGNIGIVVFNHSDAQFEYKKGDRCAQIIPTMVYEGKMEQVDFIPESKRGEGGFGSTGVAPVYDKVEFYLPLSGVVTDESCALRSVPETKLLLLSIRNVTESEVRKIEDTYNKCLREFEKLEGKADNMEVCSTDEEGEFCPSIHNVQGHLLQKLRCEPFYPRIDNRELGLIGSFSTFRADLHQLRYKVFK